MTAHETDFPEDISELVRAWPGDTRPLRLPV